MDEGERLKREGMKTVEEQEKAIWKKAYYEIVADCLNEVPIDHLFSIEIFHRTVRKYIGEPHHPNTFSSLSGRILDKWRRQELIILDHIEKSIIAKNRSCLVAIYRRVR